MTQSTLIAIGTMLNAFPAAQGDVDVLVRSFEAATENVAPIAVCEAARRFMTGEVQNHNPRYAPTVAEFAIEARRVAELKQAIARPRLPSPARYRDDRLPAPFQVREEQLRVKYAAWTTVRESASYDEYWALRRARQIPHNATWVPGLNGRICTPPEALE